MRKCQIKSKKVQKILSLKNGGSLQRSIKKMRECSRMRLRKWEGCAKVVIWEIQIIYKVEQRKWERVQEWDWESERECKQKIE